LLLEAPPAPQAENENAHAATTSLTTELRRFSGIEGSFQLQASRLQWNATTKPDREELETLSDARLMSERSLQTMHVGYVTEPTQVASTHLLRPDPELNTKTTGTDLGFSETALNGPEPAPPRF
jgi:hypothetical protein